MQINKKLLMISILSFITFVNLSYGRAYNNHYLIPHHLLKSTDKNKNHTLKVNYCSSSMISYNELKKQCKLLAEAEQSEDIKDINNSMQNIIWLYNSLGNYKKALEYCKKLKMLGLKYKNNDLIFNSYYCTGQVYGVLDNLELALINYFKAIKYSSNKSDLVNNYCNIVQIYTKIANYKLALFYAQTAKKIVNKTDNNSNKYIVQRFIANIYSAQKKYKKTIKTLKNALSNFKTTYILKFYYNDYCRTIGTSYYKLGIYDKALFFLRKSINKNNKPCHEMKIMGRFWLGYVYLKKHDYKKAYKYFNDAKLLNSGNVLYFVMMINKGFYELYSAENRIDKAYKHLVIYQKAEEQYYKNRLKASALISSNKYINQHVSMLKKDILQKTHTLRMANLTNTLLIIISALVLVLVIFFFFLYISKKQHGSRLVLLNENLDNIVMEKTKELRESFSKLRNEIEAREKIENEIKIATEIQKSILPNITSKFIRPEFTLYAKMEPGKDAPGDFYDFFYTADGKLAMILADTSETGITAAFFMTFAKTAIKNICLNEKDPSEALKKANKILATDNVKCIFTTLLLLYYDIETGNINFANAGHHPAIKLGDKSINSFGCFYNMALGVMGNTTYKSGNINLKIDETIICYTDGVIEAVSPSDEEYGEKRFYELLKKNRKLTPSEISCKIIKNVKNFEDDNRCSDVTILAFKRIK
ncbi:MAG TPA: SpoIIE family protein phosphatase [Victivallales bacterium]|nr:SpoIIE family protein phosphatase [Victivallales bacterium]